MFQEQLRHRWGRKLHMGSTKPTLPVLKALGARKSDNTGTIWGSNSSKEGKQQAGKSGRAEELGNNPRFSWD